MSKIKVLIADDHAVVRDGFKILLESKGDIEIVGEAADGREAVTLTRKLKPNVVLMDVGMPVLNGIEATRIIKNESSDVRVVFLSMYQDEEYIREALDAGASGYLLKELASKDVFKAIHDVNVGKMFFSPLIADSAMATIQKLSEDKDTQNNHNFREGLSPREREVLQLIAEGHSSKNIASILEISVKTVGNHRQSIMKKLDTHDVAGLTRYAINKGIIQHY